MTSNNGNLLQQRIRKQGTPGLDLTQSYGYDSLNRITNASETPGSGSAWSAITYGLDRYGNRWVSAGYKPFPTLTPVSSAEFNAATNRMVSPSGYDAVGNQTTNKVSQTATYDAENRMISYNGGAGITNYSYDGEGRRISKQVSGGATTYYVYNVSGQLAAEYSSQGPSGGGITYLTSDHLGSTRVTTDAAKAFKTCHDYLPYGEEIDPAYGGRSGFPCYTSTLLDGPNQKFTGKERDAESGLDYFGARYFSSPQGRFTSPDPLLNSGRPDDPQSWNRYAYVNNNPLRYRDPLGMYKWATNCDEANDSSCKADRDRFRAAYAELKKAASDLDGSERKQLEKVIKRIGEEGKGSTRVAFGDAGSTDGLPNYGLTVGNKMTINLSAIDQTKKDFQLNPTETQALDAGVVGHEGAHLGTGGIFTEFLTMHGEHTAYYTESLTYQGLHNTDRPFNLWNESWLKVDRQLLEQKREKAIQDAIHPPKPQPPAKEN
ncbi:MAG: RHS repeat-associated core domain-containing protein [Terriglobia bacterium]